MHLNEEGERVVLIVTSPLSELFQSIAAAISTQHPHPSPLVDWTSHDNFALPDIPSRLKFSTHYALYIINRTIWESRDLNLMQKFQTANFWHHPGDSGKSCSNSSNNSSRKGTKPGDSWDRKRIERIDSGEEIGRTDMSDAEITEVYKELIRGWKYMPVYWNCHDFAIRLAHIIIPPCEHVAWFLRKLLDELQAAYQREFDPQSLAKKLQRGGVFFTTVGCVSGSPPVAMIGAGSMAAGSCIERFNAARRTWKLLMRYKYISDLEKRFPILKSLHH